MAVTGKLYGNALLNALKKTIDYLNDNIACTLHTATYTPDQDVHDFVDDLTNELATAGGYTAGGQNLAGKTLTYTGATNKIVADANDVQWTSASFTARTAVLSDRTPGTAATQPLLVYQQSDADITSSGGNFDVVWNASGIIEITVG